MILMRARSTNTGTNTAGPADGQQILRCWIEVLELVSQSVRVLPLTTVTKIHIPRKRNETQKPNEEILQLKDDTATLEAKTLDDLATQLREKYPDPKFQRTLHMARNREAEQRHSDAMNRMVQHIVESFVNTLSPDNAAALGAWSKTKEGKNAFRESWPKMVDAYFHALSNPRR
jgi:hypothetical protein